MILAWHFVKIHHFAPVLRDGVTIVPDVMTHTEPLELCKSGLHASERAIDALGYAPGPIVCRVECDGDGDGEIVRGNDKLVCAVRRVLWLANARAEIKRWACDCAERALLREREHGREPDARSWRGIEVQRAYLDGRATLDELKQAEKGGAAAAYSAAYAAYAARADTLRQCADIVRRHITVEMIAVALDPAPKGGE